jgi:hypothetical protein
LSTALFVELFILIEKASPRRIVEVTANEGLPERPTGLPGGLELSPCLNGEFGINSTKSNNHLFTKTGF